MSRPAYYCKWQNVDNRIDRAKGEEMNNICNEAILISPFCPDITSSAWLSMHNRQVFESTFCCLTFKAGTDSKTIEMHKDKSKGLTCARVLLSVLVLCECLLAKNNMLI